MILQIKCFKNAKIRLIIEIVKKCKFFIEYKQCYQVNIMKKPRVSNVFQSLKHNSCFSLLWFSSFSVTLFTLFFLLLLGRSYLVPVILIVHKISNVEITTWIYFRGGVKRNIHSISYVEEYIFKCYTYGVSFSLFRLSTALCSAAFRIVSADVSCRFVVFLRQIPPRLATVERVITR